jgi:hypothetical protein
MIDGLRELPGDLHSLISEHCSEGDRLAEANEFEAAVAAYNEGWKLVPEPKNEWQASTWILAAIGDACFHGGFKTSAREAFQYAITCPGGLGNPFLHLRLGQVLFDANELDGAADELIRAYMGGGRGIFDAEPPQYLEFLSTRAAI